jgi:hypothetical protein
MPQGLRELEIRRLYSMKQGHLYCSLLHYTLHAYKSQSIQALSIRVQGEAMELRLFVARDSFSGAISRLQVPSSRAVGKHRVRLSGLTHKTYPIPIELNSPWRPVVFLFVR